MKTQKTHYFSRLLLAGLAGFAMCALPSPLAAQDKNAVSNAAPPSDPATILVEAEGFTDKGGWSVDPQYMEQMGSPVLLAHGMGRPVADANTVVEFPKPGKYRIFVRTRNWVAKWTPQHAPGVFKLVVNNDPLPAVFGNTGAAWHWQPGGEVEIRGPRATISLRDLTGFAGRCDAIIFTSDPGFTPPEAPAALAAFRRAALGLTASPKDAPDAPEGPFDLVVGGAGMGGLCTAIAAARLGVKVALIQDRPVLGGNNSSEIRVHLRGRINYPPYENIGNLVGEIDPFQTGIAQPASEYGDDKKLALVFAEPNITLYLSTRITAVEMDNAAASSGYPRPAIKSVTATNIETGREMRFEARWFADCTGDGALGHLAGAECRMGRESRARTGESLAPENPDAMTLGSSTPWNTIERFDTDGKPLATTWPALPWAHQFNDETGHPEIKGDWDWEAGIGKDHIADAEEIRDNLFRAAYGHWSWMKNQTPAGWEQRVYNRELTWLPHILGKRETRRIMGDIILRQQDIILQKSYPDACVVTTWDIDLHFPAAVHKKHFPGDEFKAVSDRRKIQNYHIPYRCFYSKDVPNLFMAGRNISVTHVALGSVRVMRTIGMMGEVVGMAAAVCKTHNATPRDVYEKHFPDLVELMKKGIAPRPVEYQTTARPRTEIIIASPAWLVRAGANIATGARLEVSSPGSGFIHRITDGAFDYVTNQGRWFSDKSEGPHHVIFRYYEPVSINALRVVSGASPGVNPVTDFVLQYKTAAAAGWIDIEPTRTRDNTRIDYEKTFPHVTAAEFRLLVTKTPGNIARLWDVQFYDLPDNP